jgi:excinuclease ABC subunit C
VSPAPPAPPATSPLGPSAPWVDRVRAETRNHPGVYRFLGPRGETLYVGKSVNLRNRLLSWLRGDDRKATELLRVTHGVEWEYAASEFEAILREFRLIRELRPRFNVVHRRDRTFAWIRLTAEPAPRLVATLRPGAGPTRRGGRRGERIFGPFPARRSLPRDLDALAAVLGLRDCAGTTPMHFSDQVDLWGPTVEPGCARAELGTCPAPCAAGCSEAAYQVRVDEAVAFLEGRSNAPLETLTSRMLDAAERQAFEFAARCRDRIERLSRLRDRIIETRSRIEGMTFVYEADDVATGPSVGAPRHHLVRRGQVLLSFDAPAAAAPEDGVPAAAHAPALVRARLEHRIREALREPAPPLASLDDEAREELFVVTRWFRTHPAEESRTTPVPAYLEALASRP